MGCAVMLTAVILSSFCFFVCVSALDCPCSDVTLCEPIKNTTRKEVFGFSLQREEDVWSKYNWSKLTTLVMVGYVNLDLMCLAHKNGARVVTIANIPKAILPNATARADWLNKQLKVVQDNFLDGINIDFEDQILENETSYRDAYTKLISETYAEFKKANQFYQITVDVAWASTGIDRRYYDYSGMVNVTDFLFVMAYDEQSQIRGPCVAGPNSPLPNAIAGIKSYMALGIPSSKLVLGVPWYGYLYPCINITKETDTCYIKHVPFRGVNCSDAAGSQINYSSMKSYLEHSKGLKWNDQSQTPYFDVFLNNKTYQIHFDDPKSLQIKYDLVQRYDLRGLGMWNTDALDYKDNSTEALKERTQMWGAIPNM